MSRNNFIFRHMKYLIFLFAFFGVLLANAQEMDTTFVVNEQGQTVGIIHEKGTVPVIPQQQPVQQPTLVQVAPQANPAFGFDSTVFYQSLIDSYTNSGNSLRRTGKGMMVGGGIGAGVGLVMFIIGIANAEETCDEYYDSYYGSYREDCSTNGDEAALAVAGYLTMIAGSAIFSTGIVLKIVGNAKLRKANRYNDILARYHMRRQYSMKLKVQPKIDPINNNIGGRLALEF